MTKESPILKLSAVLLCDEVRKEDNGKEILIGVYTGDLLVPKFPTSNSVCLWLLAETQNLRRFEKEFRVVNSKGKKIFSGNLVIEVMDETGGPGSIPLQNLKLDIEEAGLIKFQWRDPKKRWSTLLSKNIGLKPDSQQT